MRTEQRAGTNWFQLVFDMNVRLRLQDNNSCDRKAKRILTITTTLKIVSIRAEQR
jgi:hypothetical protein